MKRFIRWTLLLVLWVGLVWELVPLAVIAIGDRDCLQGYECYHTGEDPALTIIGGPH
jgi:hypothetical protein